MLARANVTGGSWGGVPIGDGDWGAVLTRGGRLVESWGDEYEWPPARTQFVKFFLSSGGRAIQICEGIRGAACRESLEHPMPIVPGRARKGVRTEWHCRHRAVAHQSY